MEFESLAVYQNYKGEWMILPLPFIVCSDRYEHPYGRGLSLRSAAEGKASYDPSLN